MGLPHVQEARSFYQSAKQRFENAEFLLEAERTTGAIYLAGYSVECMLKALILSTVPPDQRVERLASFRGARAHDFDWLKAKYFAIGGPSSRPPCRRTSPWLIRGRPTCGTKPGRRGEVRPNPS